MAAHSYDELREHIGHRVVCVCYGEKGKDPANVAVECETCSTVLMDYNQGESDYDDGQEDELLKACKCALADLEGIMPEHEPSGERTHPAWQTIQELREAIGNATGEGV